ncbi:hypothetical protein APX81_25585 [Escherichia coli]|nr:hypothetical protein [Escherichia coli]EEW6032120.1 hypothetical protein [Escherichia coli]EFN9261342.1 hypothetical protein [Escherichia coli]KIH32200.1 hypothetical protein PU13_04385 [Escherichia coli]PAZ22981.1 hypothetical protein APU33_25340 [Escherichia coli]
MKPLNARQGRAAALPCVCLIRPNNSEIITGKDYAIAWAIAHVFVTVKVNVQVHNPSFVNSGHLADAQA